MQLALIIIAILAALLFVISLLSYAAAGFRHHFVTGLIALFPVLNIVTLPTLWDRNSGKFFLGLISLVIAIAAWVFGANSAINNLLSNKLINNDQTVFASTTPKLSQNIDVQTLDIHGSQQEVTGTKLQTKRDLQLLPKKALYKIEFNTVPVNTINSLLGRVVQITTTNNQIIEGRITKLTTATVLLDNISKRELPIVSIKQVKLMIKRPN